MTPSNSSESFKVNDAGLYIPRDYSPAVSETENLDTVEGLFKQTLKGIQRKKAHQDGMFAMFENCPSFFEYTSNPDNIPTLNSYLAISAMASMRDMETTFPPDAEGQVFNYINYSARFIRDEYYNGLSMAYNFGNLLSKRTNVGGLSVFDRTLWIDHIQNPIKDIPDAKLDYETDHQLCILTRLEQQVGKFPELVYFSDMP